MTQASDPLALRPARARRVVVTLATVFGVLLTARLGCWQLDRAAQKLALQSEIDTRARLAPLSTAQIAHDTASAAAQHQQPVVARGRWDPAHTVFLENRQMHGQPGFYVVTPLKLEGRADAVLVQRGWAPRDIRDRTLLPEVKTPGDSIVEIRGVIAPPPARLLEFGDSGRGPIRQNLDLAAFSAEAQLPLAPVSIQQRDSPASAGDGLLRDWPHPAVDVQKHYGYAFQWFAMAALMAGLYVWFQLVRPRLRRRA